MSADAAAAEAMDTTDIFGDGDAGEDLGEEIARAEPDEIAQRTRMLENEIKVLRNETSRLLHEQQTQKEKIKDNAEKIKLNKQLPYLVANVVELLDMDPEEEPEEVRRNPGSGRPAACGGSAIWASAARVASSAPGAPDAPGVASSARRRPPNPHATNCGNPSRHSVFRTAPTSTSTRTARASAAYSRHRRGRRSFCRCPGWSSPTCSSRPIWLASTRTRT